MKIQNVLCLALFVLGVGLFLLQMWFSVWSEELFLKIMVTDVLLFAVCFVIAFLLKEEKDTKKLHNEGSLK